MNISECKGKEGAKFCWFKMVLLSVSCLNTVSQSCCNFVTILLSVCQSSAYATESMSKLKSQKSRQLHTGTAFCT